MGDLKVARQNWLVSPTKEIEDMWIRVKIQETKSRISRHKQDIEDLEKGRILDLRAKIKILELELAKLESETITDAKIVE